MHVYSLSSLRSKMGVTKLMAVLRQMSTNFQNPFTAERKGNFEQNLDSMWYFTPHLKNVAALPFGNLKVQICRKIAK